MLQDMLFYLFDNLYLGSICYNSQAPGAAHQMSQRKTDLKPR